MAIAFFLLVHDPFTGKLLISEDLLGCGLVGAQLCDLMIAGRLQMVDGRVTAIDTGEVGADDIPQFVVDSIARQPDTHVVRTWTENLGPLLLELVARDIVGSGVLRRETGGGLLRRRADRFPAVDLLKAAAPKVRLEHALRNPQELDLALGFLAALVWALGVDRILDPSLDRVAAREVVDEVLDHLPATLGELVDGIRSAAAAISLRVRR
jgi:hypothetical protein